MIAVFSVEMPRMMVLAVVMATTAFLPQQAVAARERGAVSILDSGTIEFKGSDVSNVSETQKTLGTWDETLDCEQAKAAGPLTFFYKEWCPFCQKVFVKLHQMGKWTSFRDNNNMGCFSSFADLIILDDRFTPRCKGRCTGWDLAEKVPKLIKNPSTYFPPSFVSQGWIDPNIANGSVPCDMYFSERKSKVHDDMVQAWKDGHDVSCTSKFRNDEETVPALVIGGTKYCESSFVLNWIEKCGHIF